MVKIDLWKNCYASGWPKEVLIDEAWSHPAKFSYNLIQRIYQHARGADWLSPGSVVLDPFGGVALGALEALRLGCAWIGCELEPRFFQIGQDNLSKWCADYRHLPGFGPWALLVNGDSRRLPELLPGIAQACVTSPPWEASLSGGNGVAEKHDWFTGRPKTVANHHGGKVGQSLNTDYGSSPGQLGAMPTGTLVVTSPPYTGSQQVDNRATVPSALSSTWAKRFGTITDGQHADQLANADPDTFWTAAQTILTHTYNLLRPGGHAIFVVKNYVRAGAIVDFTGQWAALCQQCGFVWLHHHQALLVEDHGTQGGLFGKETTVTTERKSFFRRLHEKKRPDLAINYESVLCFVKPGPGTEAEGGAALCVSSPPYAESCVKLGHIDWSKTHHGSREAAYGTGCAAGVEATTGYGSTPGNLGNMPPGATP